MASRQGQSAAPRPSTVELPSYEPPSHPLNPAAQRALHNLHQTHSLKKLQDHLKQANHNVTTMAGEINDRLEDERRRKRKNRRQQGSQEEGSGEQELEEMRLRVEKMTQRMEESIRKIIDGQHAVSSLEDSLRYVQNSVATATQATQRSTQQTQRRPQHNPADSDEDLADFDPTAPATTAGSQPVRAPSTLFQQRMQRNQTDYQTLSLRSRYAENNDYIGFKRLVWDAQHQGDDAPPLPHASTWFSEKGPPAPGITAGRSQSNKNNNAAAAADESDDDDIAIAREKVSTKCPLTLQEFKEPVTSRKCPHSFEKDAILELIRESRARAGMMNRRCGRAGEPAVQCPVSGCTEMLVQADLYTDALLLRKIRRIQQSRDAERSDDEADGDGDTTMLDRAESIASDSAEDVDVVERRSARKKSVAPKVEKSSGRPPPSSRGGIVDLGGNESDEED